jgi:pimeloyl-ACP methyl ester carboxylesterase
MSQAPPNDVQDYTIQLRDGRMLGYAEYGSPAHPLLSSGHPPPRAGEDQGAGPALLYFHGHPGSRLEAAFLAGPAREAGIRLIGVDRPGMGLSTYKAGRRILDWPGDVTELADALGIDTFAVAGFSGGGPYAAACAHRIPDRLTACGLVAGVGRPGPLLSFLASWLPWLLIPIIERSMKDGNKASKMLSGAAQRWVAPDRKSFLRPEVARVLTDSLMEAFHQGARGPACDGSLIGQGWGFRPEDITLPVHLWHGELDQEVPVRVARETARRLPHCRAAVYPDDGHISLIADHGQEIVAALTG